HADRALAALRPAAAPATGIAVPAGTTRLDLAVRLDSTGGSGPPPEDGTLLTLTLEDRYGVRYPAQLDGVPADGATRTLTEDLSADAGAPDGAPAGPLRIVGFELDAPSEAAHVRHYTFEVSSITARTAGGTTRHLAAPVSRWRAEVSSSGAGGAPGPAPVRPVITRTAGDARTPLSLAYDSGRLPPDPFGAPPLDVVHVDAASPPPPVPAALVTDRFAAATGARAGSGIEVPLGHGNIRVRVAGVVREIPTTGPSASAAGQETGASVDGGAVLLDLRSVNRALAAAGDDVLAPGEWWFYPAPGKEAQLAAALHGRTDIDPGQIVVRGELSRRLHRDPLGAGPQSALLAAAIAAAALAAVGF
ncbi:ABC transporter permease, partial [Streptomyces fuscigenes]|nr:ABC transporter permease [Streptomyces fuscigenes]